jgi:hypothetical protein
MIENELLKDAVKFEAGQIIESKEGRKRSNFLCQTNLNNLNNSLK